MKKKLLSVLLMATSIVAISSCQKKSDSIAAQQSPVPEKKLLISSDDNWLSAANPANPYDDAGLIHNQCLQNITENVGFDDMTVPNVYAQGLSYAEETYGVSEASSMLSWFSEDNANAYVAAIGGESPPSIDALLDLTGYTPEMNDYLRTLLEDVYINDASLALSYNELKDIILTWEAGIDGTGFSDDQKQQLYVFGSIMRYSALAWNNATFPDAPGGKIMIFKLRLFGWIATAVFDAVCGTAGAIVGGPAGAAIGGAIGSGGCAAICNYNGW